MARSGVTPAGPARLVRSMRGTAVLLAAAAILVFAAACGIAGGTADQHGVVVGHLPIPFLPPKDARGKAEVIAVTVRAGQRFSVEVDTADAPEYWTQTGAGPDSRIVRVVGDFNAGSCPSGVEGCRVPYYHTLIARSPGTTMMTWIYNAASCRAPAILRARKQCPSVREVQFDIDVR
jgi:hypothetical protein